MPSVAMKTYCQDDLAHWPLDGHECVIKFGSWVYDGFLLNLSLYSVAWNPLVSPHLTRTGGRGTKRDPPGDEFKIGCNEMFSFKGAWGLSRIAALGDRGEANDGPTCDDLRLLRGAVRGSHSQREADEEAIVLLPGNAVLPGYR